MHSQHLAAVNFDTGRVAVEEEQAVKVPLVKDTIPHDADLDTAGCRGYSGFPRLPALVSWPLF